MKKISFVMGPLLALMFMFFIPFAFAENIAVIVNEKSPILSENKSSLDVKEVKDIYLGKTRFWKAGGGIKAINHKDKIILAPFVEKVCNMHVSDYQGYWVKMELEMGLSSPKVFETSKEIIRFVQYEKNSIGYVLESEAQNVSGVRIVLLLSE